MVRRCTGPGTTKQTATQSAAQEPLCSRCRNKTGPLSYVSYVRFFLFFFFSLFLSASTCVRLPYLPGGGPWGSLTRAIKVYKREAQLSIKLTGCPPPTPGEA